MSTPRSLSARKLARITPEDVESYLRAGRWSFAAAQWLAHDLPLHEALVHIAVGQRAAPWEVLELLVGWKQLLRSKR